MADVVVANVGHIPSTSTQVGFSLISSVTEKWIAEKDCVKNFEAKLIADGVLTEEEIAAQRDAFGEAMEAAVQHAEAAPAMTADEIYDGLYA